MLKWIALPCLLATLGWTTLPPAPPPVLVAEEQDLDDLSWLSGSWADETGGTRNEEHWMAPRGGMMLGINRIAREDRVGMFEYLRIEKRRDGIVYIASPRGGKATEFKATLIEEGKVCFENPKHDFPQKILYWLEDEALHAAIEGTQNGKASRMAWSWESDDLVPLD